MRTQQLNPFVTDTLWEFKDDRLREFGGAFTMITTRHIERGAEVHDSYGAKCNHRFLLNYGFSLEDNTAPDGTCPNEAATVVVPSGDYPMYEEKKKLWLCESDEGEDKPLGIRVHLRVGDDAALHRCAAGYARLTAEGARQRVDGPACARRCCKLTPHPLLKHLCKAAIDDANYW